MSALNNACLVERSALFSQVGKVEKVRVANECEKRTGQRGETLKVALVFWGMAANFLFFKNLGKSMGILSASRYVTPRARNTR